MNGKALYISRKLIYRQAVLVVPIVSIFLVTGLTLYEAHRNRQLGRELTVTKKQINQLSLLIKDLDARPPLTVIPVILQSPVEQPDFIDVLRSRAEANHITLTRWANSTGPGISTGGGGGGAPGGQPSVPADVSAINCSIEVTGIYNDLRHFLYSLTSAPRLFTLSDLVWSRNDKYPVTALKFNLTRYVSLTGDAPTKIPAATSTIAEAGKSGPMVVGAQASTRDPHNSLAPLQKAQDLNSGANKLTDSRGTQ